MSVASKLLRPNYVFYTYNNSWVITPNSHILGPGGCSKAHREN